jgi:hypothetical protein
LPSRAPQKKVLQQLELRRGFRAFGAAGPRSRDSTNYG